MSGIKTLITGVKKDPELEQQKREAETKAAEAKAAQEVRDRREAAATASGMRGYRSLLSGSFTGYKDTLGG